MSYVQLHKICDVYDALIEKIGELEVCINVARAICKFNDFCQYSHPTDRSESVECSLYLTQLLEKYEKSTES